MSYFNKKRFTMRQVVGLLVIVFLGITVIAYAAVNIPYSFTSGNPIRASEMNDNFTAVKNAFDALEAQNTSLSARITTLEGKVSALEAKDADFVTANDLSGTIWSGWIYNGQGTTASIVFTFIDSQNMSVRIIGNDSETGGSSGIQVDYTNCRYRIGNINRNVVGTISLGCNLGVLTDVRINRPYNNIITGSAFIGNSTLDINHPKLSHGDFYLSKI